MHKLFDLTGKIAVVSGISSENGLAMAGGLADAGADIVGIDNEDLETARADIEGRGRKFWVYKFDLTDFKSIPALVSEIVQKAGGIDILINYDQEIDQDHDPNDLAVDYDEYLKVINLNQNATMLLTMQIYEVMKKQNRGGRIIFASSLMTIKVSRSKLAYTASKNAVMGIMKTFAAAGPMHEIWVNAIVTGPIWCKELFEAYPDLDEKVLEQTLTTLLPCHKLIKPESLRGIAVFLSSPASWYILGQSFGVDGGLSTRM